MRRFVAVAVLLFLAGVVAASNGLAAPAPAIRLNYLQPVVDEADTIVIGRAVSAGPGRSEELRELALLFDFNTIVHKLPIICVKPSVFLKGRQGKNNGDKLCFYRIDDFVLAFSKGSQPGAGYGQSGIWILNRSPRSNILYASRTDSFQPTHRICLIRALIQKTAMPTSCDPREAGLPGFPSMEELRMIVDDSGTRATPLLRFVLKQGTPEVKHRIIQVFSRYELTPLIPDIIELILDAEQIPPIRGPRDVVVPGSVGSNAVSGLAGVALTLDGKSLKERGAEFSLSDLPYEDFAVRAKRVQLNWQKWWEEYSSK